MPKLATFDPILQWPHSALFYVLIFINDISITSGLTNPSSDCLNFKAMHDGVKAQREKCMKVSFIKIEHTMRIILKL